MNEGSQSKHGRVNEGESSTDLEYNTREPSWSKRRSRHLVKGGGRTIGRTITEPSDLYKYEEDQVKNATLVDGTRRKRKRALNKERKNLTLETCDFGRIDGMAQDMEQSEEMDNETRALTL